MERRDSDDIEVRDEEMEDLTEVGGALDAYGEEDDGGDYDNEVDFEKDDRDRLEQYRKCVKKCDEILL